MLASDQQTVTQAFLGLSLDLGSAVKFVLGLTTELGLYTQPTRHTTQSA